MLTIFKKLQIEMFKNLRFYQNIMHTPTEKYLIKLYRDYVSRQEEWTGKRPPFCEDMPKTISYDDGDKIILENDITHPTLKNFDKVTIQTPKGSYILNEMAKEPVFFFDTGEDFRLLRGGNKVNLWEYKIHYGSLSLQKTKRNIYSLLHEFCHAELFIDKRYGPKVELEPAAWNLAERLIEEMGLSPLFESDGEMRLYRDIHLRTYDLFSEHGIIQESLMTQIDYNRFDLEVLNGLSEATSEGLELKELCEKLIREKAKLTS